MNKKTNKPRGASQRTAAAKQFGARLKKAMSDEKRPITEAQIARKLNIKRSTVAEWVTGRIPQDTGKALQLAKLLGCDFQYLMTGEYSKGAESPELENPNLQMIESELGDALEIDNNSDSQFTGLFLISAKRVRLNRRKP